MADRITKAHRSWNMSQIGAADTKPEIAVRSLLHSMGYRFRLHRKDLVGRPDVVLPRYRAVIFVHGCFWHRHAGCRFAYVPKSRQDFWLEKFDQNVKRDSSVQQQLTTEGWKVVTIWECEVNDLHAVAERIERELGLPSVR